MACKSSNFDMEWTNIQKTTEKLQNILLGQPDVTFTPEEYMINYTTVYNICRKTSADNNIIEQLYHDYRNIYERYIDSVVLPLLAKEYPGEFFLRELVKTWRDHKVMVRWLSHFFIYLDRVFTSRVSLPSIHEVGIICFREMVCKEMNARVVDVVLSLIEKEREKEKIDRALLKNVVDVFVEVGMKELEYYQHNFEAAIVEDTGKYYSRKASSWIMEDSCPDYMVKAEECLKSERERVSHYLHSSSEQKLVGRVQRELLLVYESQSLEKEDSRFQALIHRDKVEVLSRIFGLYIAIPDGLEPIGDMFKQIIALLRMSCPLISLQR